MQFVCRVGTPDGRVLEETISAGDEASLRTELAKRGYHLFDVRRRGVPRKLGLTSFSLRRKKVSAEEFVIWNQELAALLKAGLPLLQALDLMLERMHNAYFKGILTDVRDRVKSGVDLSEAFASYGDVFPRLYPSTLKAGERSGELEKVIRRFIRYMRLLLNARRQVISALIYPTVLVGLSIAMMIIMAIYVVPKFMGFFSELDAELPLITQIVLAISSFASRNWPVLLVGTVAATYIFNKWGETSPGRLAIDRFKLRLLFLGPVLHRFALAEFCRSLGTLLAGGIPLVPAFEIAASSVGNVFVRSRLEPTIQLVREGKPFYSALEESGVFVDMAIDMVKVGEATGSLDEMLGSVADFLDEQIETRMQRILSLIEPLMLVVMGVMIAILLISIYLPLFGLLGSSKF
ncbi:MAG TPA: hypothetical protein DD490_02785 [Acidobacteria bacterium]|nr:hypothetical protein [Acidobacteriota bacterium]